MKTGELNMTNAEWKKGYEEGFAAGWKAAVKQNELNYKNFPPVYYGGTMNESPQSSYTTDSIRNLTVHTFIV